MNKKVFIIEDDDSIRSNINDLLTMEGYDVRAFPNGKEGLDALEKTASVPQLILLDLMMPVMNGYDFLRELAKADRFQKVQVLVLSSDRQASTEPWAEQVKGFFKKPFDIDPFLRTIERILA